MMLIAWILINPILFLVLAYFFESVYDFLCDVIKDELDLLALLLICIMGGFFLIPIVCILSGIIWSFIKTIEIIDKK